jgi:hypothetical protein
MAYLAGLSFWAKLFKYFVNLNHMGRYYDRRYKIYIYEEQEQRRSILKHDSLQRDRKHARSNRSDSSHKKNAGTAMSPDRMMGFISSSSRPDMVSEAPIDPEIHVVRSK